MNEKDVFHLVLCGVVFVIGYTMGQKKAAAAQAAQTAAAPLDPTNWFATYGGLWR